MRITFDTILGTIFDDEPAADDAKRARIDELESQNRTLLACCRDLRTKYDAVVRTNSRHLDALAMRAMLLDGATFAADALTQEVKDLRRALLAAIHHIPGCRLRVETTRMAWLEENYQLTRRKQTEDAEIFYDVDPK